MKKLKTDASLLQSCVSVSVTDLRVGNFVKDEVLGLCEIESIFKQGQVEVSVKNVALDGKIGKRYFILNTDSIKPIPLTEEWLLKFGFSVINENSAGKRYGYVIGGIFSSDLTFSFWKTTKESGKFFRRDLELKSVHQLQNVYFALIGSELQIVDLTEH
jgi:hypothetical protein